MGNQYSALEGSAECLGIDGGASGTSTRKWRLRRMAFLGAVVGATTSGAEANDWSCAQLRKMDAMICRFLMVKTDDAEARKG